MFFSSRTIYLILKETFWFDILTVSEKLVCLTFEIIEFINTDHQYATLIKLATKIKLAEIIFNQSKSSILSDIDRIRIFSETSVLHLWFTDWITNKAIFKKTVLKFEKLFFELIENLIIKSNSIIKQSKKMTLIAEFSVNQQSSSSQSENDRIIVIVIKTFEAYLRNRDSNITSNANSNSTTTNDFRDHIKKWICEDIDFFDLNHEDDESIVNVDKHVFYRDVYAFVDRLKNMTVHRKSNKIRNVIPQCLRNFALIWHSSELSDLKKDMLKETSLTMWYNVLIKRFKQRTSTVLISIQASRYILKDARRQKNFRVFAQDLFKHVKAIDMTSIHNQMIMTWNNLDWQFRKNISKSIESTTIRHFLDQLDNHADIWFEMTKSKRSSYSNRKFFVRSSHQNNDKYPDKTSDQNDSNRDSYRMNKAYQNDFQKRRNDRSRVNITTKIEKRSKQSEKKFDKNVKNKSYDRIKSNRNRYEIKYKQKIEYKQKNERNKNDSSKKKIKAFVTTENKSNDFDDDLKNYHQFENLSYYDSNYEYENMNEFDITINLTMISDIVCRQCQTSFSSNNALHKHLKFCRKIDNTSALNAAISFSKISSFIFRFNVDVNKNVKSDYDFKKWQYASVDVILIKDMKSLSECINIEAEIILSDITFFKSQIKNISIKTMTSSIIVNELKTTKHSTNKYVIVFMYFPDKDQNDKSATTLITKEIHLVDNLKTNILIENDILESEKFDVFISTSSAHIESCDIIISIFVRNRSTSRIASVHSTKIMIISSQIEQIVRIHKISLSERDYIFESADVNFFIYSHLIDITIDAILIRNDNNKKIKISRNFRLNKFVELDYINAFQINHEWSDLALRKSKAQHKSFWLNKVFTATIIHINTNNHDEVSDEIDKSIKDVKMTNDIIAHNFSEEVIHEFNRLIIEFSHLWIDQEFADLFMKNWMRLSLKSDWETNAKSKVKIYSFDFRNKTLMNETFDQLQAQERLSWTNKITLFSYSCFVVWRDSSKKRKNRVVIDIRDLNVISQFDSYSLPLQSDIIQAVQECRFISVIDCVSFFYQWRVHSNDRHKFTVVTHREQETFNVAVMKYRNSSVYVQKQIDRILRSFNFARAYVNDIVIFFETLDDHFLHFRKIFEILIKNNIFINSKKIFLRYSSVSLLNQHVISLKLFTNKKKLKTIVNFRFSKTLRQLKTYFDLTSWFRQYIEHYAIKFKFLQDKKTILLKSTSKAEKERRFYTSKIKINSTNFELKFFNIIQETLFKSIYLVHFNAKLQLYANLDSSKEIDVKAMIYHVNWDENTKAYPSRKSVRSIMFLSRQLNSSKQRYWFIELEFAELIWMLKKIRHLIEFIELSIIMFIDHDAALEIIKQTFLSISSIDKLNLKLIRVFDYIQRFNLLIKHKPEKLRLISDALFRLPSNNASNSDHDELNVLFIAILIEMTFEFRNRILNEYIENSVWKKVLKTLDSSEKDNIDLLFLRDNDLIYRKKISHNMPFTSRRLCISTFVVKNILSLVHDENHSEFDRTYLQIVSSWYIQRLTKHIKAYIKHCLKCSLNQTRRHKPYESLQSILTSSVPFHSIAIDFILALFISSVDMNAIMSVICKFSKRITAISEKFTWTVFEWIDALLQRLDIADWDLFKNIIFDKDKKFLSDL